MNLRHLSFLISLERERHFGRAAERCNVTQPTLSGALRQLETELGVPIVDRTRQRFIGFTPEGARILEWARVIVADSEALRQDLDGMRGELTGRLRLGVIPAAMPMVSVVTSPFCQRHSRVSVTLLSRSSIEIQAGLEAYQLDAGLTYLDNEAITGVRSIPLYREHYVLLTPTGGAFENRRSVTWREAASLPMCLLTSDMQNRRIVNRIFGEAGAEPRVRVDTNSIMAIHSHVRFGGWSTIVPHTFLYLLGELAGMRRVLLTEPNASHSVGLVVPDRDPQSPLVTALLAELGRSGIAADIDRLIAADPDPSK